MKLEPITKHHRWTLENAELWAAQRKARIAEYHKQVALRALLNDQVRLIGTRLASTKDETRSWTPKYEPLMREANNKTFDGYGYGSPRYAAAWASERAEVSQYRNMLRVVPDEWKVKNKQRAKEAARRVFDCYRKNLSPVVKLTPFAENCRVDRDHAVVPLHYVLTAELARRTGLGDKFWLLGSNKIGYDPETNASTYRIYYASAEVREGRDSWRDRGYRYSPTGTAYVICEDVPNSPIWAKADTLMKAREAYRREAVKVFTKELGRAA